MEYMDFAVVDIRQERGLFGGIFEFVFWSDIMEHHVTAKAIFDGYKLSVVSGSGDPGIDDFIVNSDECIIDVIQAVESAKSKCLALN